METRKDAYRFSDLRGGIFFNGKERFEDIGEEIVVVRGDEESLRNDDRARHKNVFKSVHRCHRADPGGERLIY